MEQEIELLKAKIKVLELEIELLKAKQYVVINPYPYSPRVEPYNPYPLNPSYPYPLNPSYPYTITWSIN